MTYQELLRYPASALATLTPVKLKELLKACDDQLELLEQAQRADSAKTTYNLRLGVIFQLKRIKVTLQAHHLYKGIGAERIAQAV